MKFDTTLSENEPIAITIGNFDGIHKGHQHLMQELRETAAELNCKPVLVTFSPHTLMVVRPEIDVQVLTTLEEKLALAKRYGGIDESQVIHFTPEVMAMSASDFLDAIGAHFPIQALVVGENFSLGHNRMGNVAFLEEYGQQRGIVIRAIPLEADTQTRISSTRIRALVNDGRVGEANELLGHPVTMSGVVVHGDHRGRLLGFPTANLMPPAHKLIPANGVYAVRVSVPEEESTTGDSSTGSHVYTGVANVGIRPTFNGKERIVEVHLLDVNPDLYNIRITIDFIEHLRSEQRFPGIDALKAQIATDAQQARQILQTTGGG
jgi:riboflavin kinase/FMN adenylyltransferase